METTFGAKKVVMNKKSRYHVMRLFSSRRSTRRSRRLLYASLGLEVVISVFDPGCVQIDVERREHNMLNILPDSRSRAGPPAGSMINIIYSVTNLNHVTKEAVDSLLSYKSTLSLKMAGYRFQCEVEEAHEDDSPIDVSRACLIRMPSSGDHLIEWMNFSSDECIWSRYTFCVKHIVFVTHVNCPPCKVVCPFSIFLHQNWKYLSGKGIENPVSYNNKNYLTFLFVT
ncbi:hypothetical protein Plhal304r1_c032g0102941 [Plasmopara halstedii]